MNNDGNIFMSIFTMLEEHVRTICSEILQEYKQDVREKILASRMTREEVAQMIGKDVKSVSRYESEGLKSYRIGRTPIYFKEDVEDFIAGRKNRDKNPQTNR